MNSNLRQVAMSHVGSKDEEVKSILAKIGSNDSKESDNSKKEKPDNEHINDEFNEYEDDDRDPLKHEEMDDKEW